MKGYIRISFDNQDMIWERIPEKISYKDILQYLYISLCILIDIHKLLSLLISKIVIQLYPNIFFYIQILYPDRYLIFYPIQISHRYPSISFKISIFDIHIDICLFYPHNYPILSYYIPNVYLFRYPYLYPMTISHCILLYPIISKKISLNDILMYI